MVVRALPNVQTTIGSIWSDGALAPSGDPATREFATSWTMSIIEFLTIVAASCLSGTAYHRFVLGLEGDFGLFLATGCMVGLLFCGALRIAYAGASMSRQGGARMALLRVACWVGVFLLLAFLAFVSRHSTTFSRGAVLVFFVSGLPAIMLVRAGASRLLAPYFYKSRLGKSDAILIGASSGSAVAASAEQLRRQGCINPAVVTLDAECPNAEWPGELARKLASIAASAKSARPGPVFVVADGFPPTRLSAVLLGLQLLPRAVCLVPDAVTSRLFLMPVRSFGPWYSVEVQKQPLNRAQRFAKRAIDLALAAPLLVVLAPFFAAVALAIRLDSPGPVFFRQKRLGYRGSTFTILKFRTMTVLEDGEQVQQARRDDRRVTRTGRWLRRASIDELPQLFNVLRGEMSLVGPRPHARAHDKLYAGLIENYELRQHVKPGLTGWAQVNGLRGETPSAEAMCKRVEFDIWYAKNASILLDLQILARTVLEILRQRNAY